MLLIDDCTRYAWVYFLQVKSQALEFFKVFKNHVEKQFEHRVKALRTYRGGEFTSGDFQAYCEAHGIKRQLTTPHSPQQNGVVERRNRTVVEMSRCMLKQRNLPTNLWGEAVAAAIYTLNRSSTRALKKTTSYEALMGVKPSVHHLRTFGCLVFVLSTTQ